MQGEAAPTDSGLRKSYRHRLEDPLPVILHWGGRFHSGCIIDFSMQGLRLQSNRGFCVADEIRIELFYRDTPVLCGTVEWAIGNYAGVRIAVPLPDRIARFLLARC